MKLPSRIQFFFTLLILFVLNGCTLVAEITKSSQEKFDEQIEQHYYLSALNIADKALKKNKSDDMQTYWQQRKQEVNIAAETFQRNEQQAIDLFIKEGNWLEANKKERFLSEHLPLNSTRESFSDKFYEQKFAYLDSLNRKLLLFESKQIPEYLELYEMIYSADNENASSYDRLQRQRDKRDQVMTDLYLQLAEAEERKNFNLALEYARAIQRLQDSPNILAKIKSIRNQINQRTGKASSSKNSKGQLTAKQQSQLSEYGKAIIEEKWVSARTILDKMLADRPSDGELLGQDTYLKEVFFQRVSEAKAEGERLYSAGNIESALKTWRAVSPMAPKDLQLASNIERAQRILDKVESLKNDQVDKQAISIEKDNDIKLLELIK